MGKTQATWLGGIINDYLRSVDLKPCSFFHHIYTPIVLLYLSQDLRTAKYDHTPLHLSYTARPSYRLECSGCMTNNEIPESLLDHCTQTCLQHECDAHINYVITGTINSNVK
jgi:hypothetical protein